MHGCYRHGVVHAVLIAKLIAIVPVSDFLPLVQHAVFFKSRIYFLLGKAEEFFLIGSRDRTRFSGVEGGVEALFRHDRYPGDQTFFKMSVAFEHRPVELPEEFSRLVPIAA